MRRVEDDVAIKDRQAGRADKGVRVHFVDGRSESFPFATNAVNRGPVFIVERHFPEHRRAESVRSFLVVDVAYALVFEPFGPRYVTGSAAQKQ